ncbi:VPS37B subunit of ESCRT-I b [Brienomyrus brachyistius]|uniref:VPS37B subunit of ESCRT-I b n=1 Tax=Brienomyrus brachyistius TaxID=42636 RepID=UPI0020B204AB|nr:VPS37B subunit of ESCRT-I b [Brienomyrus brachyistius]
MCDFDRTLSSFSLSQLNELLEDDGKLYKIVTELEEVQQVQQAKEVTLASNRTLAEQNLQLQPTLDQQKNELTKRYRELRDAFEAFQLRKSTLDQSPGNGSLDTLLALLQTEGAKIEEETENMADSFLDGDLPLDTFIDTYQSKRRLAHLRRVKIEKLQEMVIKGPLIPQAAPTATPLSNLPETPAPLAEAGGPPTPLPRRAPPLPPAVQTVPIPAQVPAPQPMAVPYPAVPYPGVPYLPVPPRMGRPMPGQVPGQIPGYPNPFLPQYPPGLPQRPPPRMAPHPGFIVQ